MPHVRCPQCRREADYPGEYLGQSVRCTHCGAPFTLQSPPQPAAKPQPAARPTPGLTWSGAFWAAFLGCLLALLLAGAVGWVLGELGRASDAYRRQLDPPPAAR